MPIHNILKYLDQTTSAAKRGATKFTFNDEEFSDGTTGEIEASSKNNRKGEYTTCTYFSDDYASYLGQFHSDTVGFTEAADVLRFCKDHYADRTP